MSSTRDPDDHGAADEHRTSSPEGRGEAGRRKLGALILGVILSIFVVLLTIWLVGRSADDVEGSAAAAGLLTAALVRPGRGPVGLTIR